MAPAYAFKQEVKFDDPVQTTTAKPCSKFVSFQDLPSYRVSNKVICSSRSSGGNFATVGTISLEPESLQEQLSYTLPSELELPDIPIEGGKLLQKIPIYIGSVFFMNEDLFRLENEDLSLFVSGFTIEELVQELYEHIDFLWTEYALEDDAELAPSGKELKHRLLERFEQTE